MDSPLSMIRLAIVALVLLLPTTAGAYDFMVDSIYYNVRNGQAEVTNKGHYSWSSEDVVLPDSYSGNVSIPSTVTYEGISYPVTAIGQYAFKSSGKMTSIIIPNSVISIGKEAFYNCDSLITLTIPNSVTTIGDHAFKGCTRLSNITIGSGVTSFGSIIFYWCYQLTDVTCLAISPPASIGYSGQFFDILDYYTHATLHVLPQCVEAYQSAMYWRDFSSILGDATYYIPGDVNGDGEITIADANTVIIIIVNGGGSSGHSHIPDPNGDGFINLADINGDGEVSIADLNALIDIILSN